MRIIAGDFRRRLLATPRDDTVTRPMPDRVREALFNLLRGHVEGQAVVDVFAGTGAIGLEALSRGASQCVFVERDRMIARLLQQNIESLRVEDQATLVTGDALGSAALIQAPRPCHLIFFDPPYPLMQNAVRRRRVLEQLSRFVGLLDDEGYAILRTPWPFLEESEEPDDPSEAPAQKPAPTEIDLELPSALGPETHTYGSTALHLYMKKSA